MLFYSSPFLHEDLTVDYIGNPVEVKAKKNIIDIHELQCYHFLQYLAYMFILFEKGRIFA
jgi:hypothetical protein